MSDRAPRGDPLADWLEAVCFGVLLGWTLVCSLARLVGDHALYLVWADRALMRSSLPWSSLPQAGAELSYDDGGRVPGGGLYTLIKLVQQVDDHPLTVFRAMTLLDLAAAALLFVWVRRLAGPTPAMFAAALYATSHLACDTAGQLWNPGFVPLFMMVGWWAWGRVAESGRAETLVVLAGASVVAAQLHLSALGAGLLLGLVALGWRPAGARRALLASAAIAVLLYAPYLVEDAARGWPNTRMLLTPSQVLGRSGAPGPTAEALGPKLWGALGLLGGRPVLAVDADAPLSMAVVAYHLRGVAVFTYVGVLLAVTPLAVWGHRRGWVARDLKRVVVGAWCAVLVALLLWATEDRVQFEANGASRYLVALAPAVPLMGAGVVAVLLAMVRAGVGRGLAAACVVAMTVGVSGRAAAVIDWTLEAGDGWEAIPRLEDLFAWQQRQTGRSLAEVLGTTVVARHDSDGWRWRTSQGSADWLRRAGERWQGSGHGPCTLVLADFPSELSLDAVDAAYIQGVMGQAIPAIDVQRVERFEQWVVVRYGRTGVCHSVFSNRYLLSAREQQAREAWRAMPIGSSRVLPAEPGTTRVVMRLPDHPGLDALDRGTLLGLDLRSVGDEVQATLWGNHIRGHAFNDGYFANALIGSPRLVFTESAGRQVVLDWSVDLVGVVGAIAPLHASVVLGPGDWRARFETDTLPWDSEASRGVQLDALDRRHEVLALEDVILSR